MSDKRRIVGKEPDLKRGKIGWLRRGGESMTTLVLKICLESKLESKFIKILSIFHFQHI